MPTTSKSVLVVDDDAEWREALTEVLVGEGYVVAMAENGAEALVLLGSLDACAVVTDLQMPIMDGQHLLAALEARGQRVPVVVVSAARAAAPGAELRGAFRVLQKPASIDRLLAAVADACAARATDDSVAAVAAPAMREPLVSRLVRRLDPRVHRVAPRSRPRIEPRARHTRTRLVFTTVFALSAFVVLNHLRVTLTT